jgi:choline-sulfatase
MRTLLAAYALAMFLKGACFGDNDWQFGEKNHWSKDRLSEGSAHTPPVLAGPGIARGQFSWRPVSFIVLCATPLELAGLPARPNLNDVSIVPLQKDPSAACDRPTLTTAGFKNHALRSERRRSIRHADGSGDLYDHDAEPLERTNLASKPECAAANEDLQNWFPKHDEPMNPPKGKGRDD